MKTISVTIPRFGRSHGWVNRVLCVDLRSMSLCAKAAVTAPESTLVRM